jgi:periplasmic protein TonB
VKRVRSWKLDPARRVERGEADRLSALRAREEARWRRARSIGIIGTTLLHLLLLLLFRQTQIPPYSPEASAGPPRGDLRAAEGGGSGLTMIEVRPEQAPPEEVVPVVPVPAEVVVVPPEVEPTPPSPAPAPTPAPAPSLPGRGAPGAGGDAGSATGPGTETGTGDGGGGTSDEGAARIIPPTPRGVFIPPAGRPASARGQEITVWVFVMENGRVQRNSVRLEPPTSDARYNQRLIQSVAEWVFDPARQGGRPVPVWYPFQIIL